MALPISMNVLLWLMCQGLGQIKSIIVIIVFVLILPALYLRYYVFTNYQKVSDAIEKLGNDKKHIYYLISLGYIILSLASTLVYTFYTAGIDSKY